MTPKDRTVPYKLLAFLLYGRSGWIDSIGNSQVRVVTGPTSRQLRIKISRLWEAVWWLKQKGLVQDVAKEEKRGSMIVTLRKPDNV